MKKQIVANWTNKMSLKGNSGPCTGSTRSPLLTTLKAYFTDQHLTHFCEEMTTTMLDHRVETTSHYSENFDSGYYFQCLSKNSIAIQHRKKNLNET